jgi:glycosyltransferase involved in cell wall biosynthesis
MPDIPLISCLCVTRDKVPLLKRAMRSFQDQTYGNRELVIVYEDDDLATRQFLDHISDSTILKTEVPISPKLTLGELRNLGIQRCNGEYFCQWDDDDWSHNNRLTFQMDVIKKSELPACIMIHWLVYDVTENQAYISNRRPWEGSIVCKRSLITDEIGYDPSLRGEDTTVISRLFSRNLVFPIVMPKLYIYVYHGRNTWGHEHWKKIFEASRKLSVTSSRMIRDILDGKYSGEKASALLDQLSE